MARECPCKIDLFDKEHLRRNPTTDKPIVMCTMHAKMHDEGHTFELLRTWEPETNR